MKKIVFIFFVLPVLMHAQIKNGMWRGVLLLNLENNIELPFNFSVKSSKGKKQLIIQNAQERIVIDNILLKNDSLNFKMPVFDSEFRTRMINDSMLEGVWINHSRTENNRIKFRGKIINTSFVNIIKKILTFFNINTKKKKMASIISNTYAVILV